jgi:uncharacterized protein YndB with AHSA1/START domain
MTGILGMIFGRLALSKKQAASFSLYLTDATPSSMPDIYHTFSIAASAEKVFAGIATAEGLDQWWTKTSLVPSETGAECLLGFGPPYQWKAVVTKYEPGAAFELQMTQADDDWKHTRVGFLLTPKGNNTEVAFYHTGWPENNAHFRISSYCWAMYLRILSRYVALGEQVPYEKRLHV